MEVCQMASINIWREVELCRFLRFLSLCFVSLLASLLILFQLATSVHSAQVTLAWDPNTEPDVTGYRIYYSFLSDQYDYSADVGNQTSFTLASLQDGKTYYFAATAYDQEGNESDFSNEVVFNAPPVCTYSVSPVSQWFGPGGGASTVNVTTASGCNWTASSNDSWLIVTSNSSFTGNGTVNYSALSNSGTSVRTGTLAVAGQSVTVAQDGMVSCTITASAGSNGSISPQGSITVSYGGSRKFTVKPKRFYRIADVRVDGVSIGAITSYTFKNVISNHSISAAFSKK
jgi:hypothetical protein